jgi:phosphatidylglycerol:prolipoprotein diacylglycerol transferase
MGRYYYPLFMLLGLLVFVLARRCLPRPPALALLPWWQRLCLALAAFVGGVLGAKLPFAMTSPAGWWMPEAWFTDGKTIMTGLAGACLAVELTKFALEIHVKTGDTFALPLALAMTVGRLGCFFNGCCYGIPTSLPWGVSFVQLDGMSVLCHPTQLYESLFHFTMAIVLAELLWWQLLPGQHLKIYLISYCVYRFLTEWIRPEPVWLVGMTFYQCVAIALALALLSQWCMQATLARSVTTRE